jgi:hypothetical protein
LGKTLPEERVEKYRGSHKEAQEAQREDSDATNLAFFLCLLCLFVAQNAFLTGLNTKPHPRERGCG